MGVEARKTAAKILLTEGSRVPIRGKQEGAPGKCPSEDE
jgi:hypothetical protein